MTRFSSEATSGFYDFDIVPLSGAHLSEIWILWKAQYKEELSAGGKIPNRWDSYREEIQSLLRKRVKSDYAMVAETRNEIVGYMFFDVFPFHNEQTAFCPIIGHATKQAHRREISEKLYQSLSKKLVTDGILNHTITYFAHDEGLKETVFELGFGLIVVDAFRGLNTFSSSVSSINIIRADSSHIDVVEALGEEARGYYLEAPLFLTRKKQPHDYYHRLFSEDAAIFLAFSRNEPVGLMQIRKNKELDPMTLSDTNTGLIDQMGAYIKPTFRRQGIGRALLLKCVQWCQHRGITRIHVDFESANLSARPFWLEYFTAALHSARRTVYRDILGPQQT
ncbi:MAG: GNAT family N-acetyltransferase [Candidatus Atabeyarchaeum deiterrae]